MKITCQACQSKYTIADDKIQGKVAKIRCRKCGATVLVDASGSTAGAATAGAEEASSAEGAEGTSWLVMVTEGEQRPMHLSEIVQAYHASTITGETYVWKDGMADWIPLAQSEAIVSALNLAAGRATSDAHGQAPAQAIALPAATASKSQASPAPVTPRGSSPRPPTDPFTSGGDDDVATSVPPQVLGSLKSRPSSPTAASSLGIAANLAAPVEAVPSAGSRDEHSVVFSLSALTSGKSVPPASAAPAAVEPSSHEDSGLIDLNALARAQADQAKRGETVKPAPFLFPAALGTVELPKPAVEVAPMAPRKASIGLLVAGGVVALGAIVAVVLFATRKPDEPVTTAPSASAAVVASAAPSAEAAASEIASAGPTPSASESAVKSPTKAPPRRAGGGGASKPAGGAPATPAAAPTQAPAAKSKCGCASGDLQCQIRCSAMGK